MKKLLYNKPFLNLFKHFQKDQFWIEIDINNTSKLIFSSWKHTVISQPQNLNQYITTKLSINYNHAECIELLECLNHSKIDFTTSKTAIYSKHYRKKNTVFQKIKYNQLYTLYNITTHQLNNAINKLIYQLI